VTHWRVLKRYGYVTLVECRLETGRTHQIRVHMAYIGHPLLGDTLYNKTPGTFPRQALHSASLSFVHPITGEPLNFHAPLPEDMQNLLT
jgi:23S rRNA pseudouridine1911/1915/1917 synthase